MKITVSSCRLEWFFGIEGAIKLLKEKGASVILMSHLGRPEGKLDKKYSLEVVSNFNFLLVYLTINLLIPNFNVSDSIIL